jgi:hypothetical protein
VILSGSDRIIGAQKWNSSCGPQGKNLWRGGGGGVGIQAAQADRLHYLIMNINQHFLTLFQHSNKPSKNYCLMYALKFLLKSTQTMWGNKLCIVVGF